MQKQCGCDVLRQTTVFFLDKTWLSLYNSNLTAPVKKEMAIKINDIPPEGLTLELSEKLDLFEKGTDLAEFKAILRVKPEGRGILHFSGRIQAIAILECSRCLTSFPYNMDIDLNVDLVPVKSLAAGPEHELVSGELDIEFYPGDEIDPVEFIKEQMLIAVPFVPLHNTACKGLCSVCGTDLNKAQCAHQRNGPEDFGSFAALKDLLKK